MHIGRKSHAELWPEVVAEARGVAFEEVKAKPVASANVRSARA
jgi:hypothetical protein